MGRKCCIGEVTRFDTSAYEVHIAGEVRGFDATEHGLTKKEARRFERFVQYAIVAADEAMAQAGLDMEREDATRVACVFGTGIGGIDELQSGFATLSEKGPKRVNPLFIPTMIGNMAAGALSIRHGFKGECLNVVTACATGAHCIGTAVRDIRHGYIDAALAGGHRGKRLAHLPCRLRQPGRAHEGRRPRMRVASLRRAPRGLRGGRGRRRRGAGVAGTRARARRARARRGDGLRIDGRRLPHDRPRPGRRGRGARDAPGACGGRLFARGRGAPERARHGHAPQRRHRGGARFWSCAGKRRDARCRWCP